MSTTPQLEHSDLIGGSSAAKRIHCPGSYQLEKRVPKGDSPAASVYAERGTALHLAMEDYLLNVEDTGAPPDDMLGVEYNGFTIDQELLDTKIKPALKAFREIIQAAGGDLDYMVEVRASLDAVIPGVFGTIDILGKGKDGRLWVIDWKFGDGVPVKVENNYQMAFYAAAALYDKDPDIVDLVGDDPLDVVFCVVQPRAHYPDEPDWQMWETDDQWIETYLDLLVDAYEKFKLDNPPLAKGDHCRWCKAREAMICPLQKQGIQETLDRKVEPASMDPVEMSSWLTKISEMEQFVKDLKAHAHKELERGVKIPGWKLVPKRGSRVYTDEEKAEALLKRKLKVSGAYKKVLISPAQAEKALGKAAYEKLLAKYVSVVSSGTTLAPETDKRPDVSDPSKHLASKLQGIEQQAKS